MIAKQDLHIYIAFFGPHTLLNDTSKEKIAGVILDLFPTAEIVSNVSELEVIEVVYKIQAPIIESDEVSAEFFSNLEVLFEELEEFQPHFTQFKGVI